MATQYSVPIEAFFKRIEEDYDFFNYLNMTEAECLKIANQRAENFLDEAIGIIMLKCCPQIDFTDRDTKAKIFNSDWTDSEIYLIASLMYQQYLERDIAKLKCLDVNYTSTDLRVFDPSNARTTFKALYDGVCTTNTNNLDDYKYRDRLTGRFLQTINYSNYNE